MTNKTFDLQKTLTSLPIPDLDNTCEKFLTWVNPMLNEEDFKQTRQIVDDFRQEGGDGQKLQQKLLAWAEKEDVSNWLESFWNDTYLSYRKPLCINNNVFYLLDDILEFKGLTSIEQAALYITSILKFKKLIDSEQLEIDMERDTPLCMNQYRKLFAATRIPQKATDTVRGPFSKQDTGSGDAKHIVVFYKGQIFKLNVISQAGGMRVQEEILKDLRLIVDTVENNNSKQKPIGILTTLPRDEWANARNLLIEAHPQNSSMLDIIETALFSVCMDDALPEDLTEIARTMMHGNGLNRWFDKSFQLIICKNGKTGINSEHSGLDGSVIGRLLKFIANDRHNLEWRQDINIDNQITSLKFQLNKELGEVIVHAKKLFDSAVENTHVNILQFKNFGKSEIKTMRISPDAFVQLSIQLAQYKFFKRCFNTYEPVMTRKFLHGRTEAVRTMTEASIAFVKNISLDSDDSHSVKLLRDAAKEHISRLADCKSGMGIQRHMLGLINMYKLFGKDLNINSMPEIFTDTGWATITHDTFSTSTSDAAGLAMAGYGPVVDDGFGIRYVTKNDFIMFCLSSRSKNKDQLKAISKCLNESLLEISSLLKNK